MIIEYCCRIYSS